MKGADFDIARHHGEAERFVRSGAGKVFLIRGYPVKSGGIKGEEVVSIKRHSLG